MEEGNDPECSHQDGPRGTKRSLEEDLNPDTVEIGCVDKSGYEKLDRETTLKHLGKLS